MIADRILAWSLAFALAWFPVLASAQSPQVRAAVLLAGQGAPGGVTYQGPGDVLASATAFYSCARVYQASLASTATSLCDLKDATTGTVAVCTLRATANGVVDLVGGYCAGGLAPAAACVAAAGGSCIISKAYNQVSPGTLDVTQATAANMPALTFSGLNGLPVIGLSGSQVLASGAATFAQPILLSNVYIRTANFTTAGGIITNGSANTFTTTGASANVAVMEGGSTGVIVSGATDSAWHAFQAYLNGGASASASNMDGTDAAQTTGTSGWSAQAVRLGRTQGGTNLTGNIAEAIVWAASTTSINRNAICHNQSSAYALGFSC